jgi:cell division protein FtsB
MASRFIEAAIAAQASRIRKLERENRELKARIKEYEYENEQNGRTKRKTTRVRQDKKPN